jgi:hypothetical protein
MGEWYQNGYPADWLGSVWSGFTWLGIAAVNAVLKLRILETQNKLVACLNQGYENRWIDPHGLTNCPPRSPEPTPLDFFFTCLLE